MGANYSRMGNYELALDYTYQAYEIILEKYPNRYESLILRLANLAVIYDNLNDKEEGIKCLNDALVLLPNLPTNSIYREAVKNIGINRYGLEI